MKSLCYDKLIVSDTYVFRLMCNLHTLLFSHISVIATPVLTCLRGFLLPVVMSLANEPVQRAGSFEWTMGVYFLLSEKYLRALRALATRFTCMLCNQSWGLTRIIPPSREGQGKQHWDGDRRRGRERSEERKECGAKMCENRKRSIWMHFDSCVNSCPILISMLKFL